MGLTFPNTSRSFDDNRNVVRFSGYDGMYEVRFLVEGSALAKSTLGAMSENDCLKAFDAARSKIQAAAVKLYSQRRGSLYTLTATDL